jgi:hypothetical protein
MEWFKGKYLTVLGVFFLGLPFFLKAGTEDGGIICSLVFGVLLNTFFCELPAFIIQQNLEKQGHKLLVKEVKAYIVPPITIAICLITWFVLWFAT